MGRVMKVTVFILIGSFILCGLSFAQDNKKAKRVLIEKWYINDPTVKDDGSGWLVGLSAELWGGYVPSSNFTSRGIGDQDAEDLSGLLSGASLYFGKDDFTIFTTLRYGSYKGDIITPNFKGNYIKEDFDGDRLEAEIKVRYLFPGQWAGRSKPYLIGGIFYTDDNREFNAVSGSWPFYGTQTKEEYQGYAPNLGLGMIMPFTKMVGLRGDISLGYLFLNQEFDNPENGQWTELDGSGLGYIVHATLYWILNKNINLQFGAKWQGYNVGGDINMTYQYGAAYLSLGYVFD